MSAADASIRSRIARIGGQTAVAKHGGHALTENARAARQTKLNESLIAEFHLDPAAPDFQGRLTAARSAYYGRMALRRSK